jgi:hypothetical protein
MKNCRDKRCTSQSPCDVCHYMAYRVLMVGEWTVRAMEWKLPVNDKDKE